MAAKVKGRFPLNVWGKKIAAVGYKYNQCPVAPERNAVAANALMPLLLGNVADWRYPNVWVRTDDIKLKGHKPQDLGWLTNEHSKGELIGYSQRATLDDEFDWADEESINQMMSIVHKDDGGIGAPEGSHDDDWMSRIITGYVAHRERARTLLYQEPVVETFKLRTLSERIREEVLDHDEDLEE